MSKLQSVDIASEAVKAAPPAAVTFAASIGGLSLNNIIGIATLLYIALQCSYLVWKWRKEHKQAKRLKFTEQESGQVCE